MDVPGVHPGDDKWYMAFDTALDIAKCDDMALRNQAFVAFDVAGAEGEMVQGEIKPQGPARPRLIRTLIHRAIKWLTEKN